MRRRTLACAFLPLLLAGCGGSGHKSSSTSGTDTIGPQIALAWPARSRAFSAPVAATAARIVFPGAGVDGVDLSQTVSRPTGAAAVTQTYQLAIALHPGRHLLRIDFLADASSGGGSSLTPLATATINIQVTGAGKLRTVDGKDLGTVAYGLEITALSIVPGQTVEVGGTIDPVVYAHANETTVALKPGSVTFSQTASGLLTLEDDGSVTGIAEGTASLTAKIDGVTSPVETVAVLPAPVSARVVSLDSTDMLFDPTRSALWVATSTAVARLDPTTGMVGASIPVGSVPNILALSDDGTTLYAGLRDLASIRRVDLTAGVAGAFYPVSPTSNGYVRYATNIAVQPGSDSVYAVNSMDTVGGGTYGPTVYDAGVARANEVDAYHGDGLAWLAPDRIVVNGSYDAGLYDVAVNAQGATLSRKVVTSRLPSSVLEILDGRLYDGGGLVFDASSLQGIGSFNQSLDGSASSPGFGPAVDLSTGRAYFIALNPYDGTARVSVYNARTFAPIKTRRISGLVVPSNTFYLTNARVSLVGSDRLAFRLPSQVVFLDNVSKL